MQSDESQDEIYTVEKIIGKRIDGSTIKYLVKWEGYPKEQSTWEPVSNLSNVLDLIEEYEKSLGVESKKSKLGSKKRRPSPSGDEACIGAFEYGDVPLSVETVRKLDDGLLMCLVKWKVRTDGNQPEDSFVSADEMKIYDWKLLMNFYESRLKFNI
jgi:hypothetical protein